MKRYQSLVTVLLILFTAATGWFLPAVISAVSEQAVARNAQPLDIAPVSLEYAQTLPLTDKFIHVEHGSFGLSLSKGVFLQEKDAKDIANAFLSDFMQETGSGIAAATILQGTDPALFVVWQVDLSTASDSYARFVIDDSTGVILSLQLALSDQFWESSDGKTQSIGIFADQFSTAYRAHLLRQEASLSCSTANWSLNDNSGIEEYGSIRLQDEDGQQINLPLRVSLYNGIGFNPEFNTFHAD